MKSKRHFILRNTISKWWRPEYERYSEEIMNIIQPNHRELILEVGVGDGRYTIPLVKKQNLVIGVDISREMLEKCVENAKHKQVKDSVMFARADIENLPLRNNIFGKVVCIATLVHVLNYEKAIQELLRVTRLGGRVITENICFFHPSALISWMTHRFGTKFLKRTYEEVAPYYPRTSFQILRAFKEKGVTIEGVFGFFLLLPSLFTKHINLLAYEGKKSFLKFFGSGLVVRARKSERVRSSIGVN